MVAMTRADPDLLGRAVETLWIQVDNALKAVKSDTSMLDHATGVSTQLLNNLKHLDSFCWKIAGNAGTTVNEAEWTAFRNCASNDFGGPLPPGHGDLAVALLSFEREYGEQLHDWEGAVSHRQNSSLIEAGIVLREVRNLSVRDVESCRHNKALERYIKIFQKIDKEGLYALEPLEARELLSIRDDERLNAPLLQRFRDRAVAFVENPDFSATIHDLGKLKPRPKASQLQVG